MGSDCNAFASNCMIKSTAIQGIECNVIKLFITYVTNMTVIV